MDRFLYDGNAVMRGGHNKAGRGRLIRIGGCALLLTLAVGKAATPQAQPVFFSMLFPQLMPEMTIWEDASMDGDSMERPWKGLLGKAVRL